jgi:GMP synthase PP-ATPase subunit
MRKDECAKVYQRLVKKLNINLKVVDASDIFFSKLQDVGQDYLNFFPLFL